MEVEIIEVQMNEVMMDINKEDPLQSEEVVQGDIEFVDLLPADAEAVFEFRDIFDVLLSGVDEEFVPIPPSVPRAHVAMRDRLTGIQYELPERHDI
ncbi:uncharacterized protein LOC126553378 [Aphis gossypii]|uniref:uncharacterized protein LOC126553378 n=1 Tax=Aphis gossypii TaxID=80765 RepID=UPI002158A27A|nr:uncharacterized protein LOC126553378 [Aphis gossypii]